jgi:hypothetical protein
MPKTTTVFRLKRMQPQVTKSQLKKFWLFPLACSAFMVSMAPASALPPNQSDITGTNVWNNTAPIFAPGQPLNPELISTARRFSQDLNDAYAACTASANAAANAPRRFARGAENPNAVCNSPECQRLNLLINDAKTFLNGLDSSQLQQLKASNVRIW